MFYYLPHIVISGIVILFFGIGSYSIYKEEKKEREENEKYLKNLSDKEIIDLYNNAQSTIRLIRQPGDNLNYEFYEQLKKEYENRIKKE